MGNGGGKKEQPRQQVQTGTGAVEAISQISKTIETLEKRCVASLSLSLWPPPPRTFVHTRSPRS